MHRSVCVRKQETLKIVCFAIGVEDYHKLTQRQFLIQSPLDNLTSVFTKTSLANARFLSLRVIKQNISNVQATLTTRISSCTTRAHGVIIN